MYQAIVRNIYFDHGQKQSDLRQWLVVVLLSVLLHAALVLWFSSLKPDIPAFDYSDFKVGLITSEGMGETVQASIPAIAAATDIATEESGLVTQEESVTEVKQNQAPEVTEELPPIEQALTEGVELAEVVTPITSATPDVAPPAIREDVEETVVEKIEESRPVEAEEVTIPSVSSVADEVPETTGVSAEIANVKPVNDFFKPAEVLTEDEPAKALPIEQLAAVPAPDAIKPDDNPDLASDVEILEIRAREVLLQKKPASRPAVKQITKKPAVQSGTGDDLLHPRQSPFARSGETPPDVRKLPAGQKTEESQSVVVPASYILELKTLLSQFKKYPKQAHRLKQEGVVIIALVIDRSGQILSHEIKRSSGFKLLDQEVQIMVQRAAKMPALPEGFPRDTLELLVPVRFKVKR